MCIDWIFYIQIKLGLESFQQESEKRLKSDLQRLDGGALFERNYCLLVMKD